MRIAFFTDAFLPSTNGVVTSMMTLIDELEKRHHTVGVFFPGAFISDRLTTNRERLELFPVSSVPSLVYPDFRIGAPSPQILLRLQQFKPDIIHVQTPASIGIQGLIASRLLKKPVIGAFHTYFMEPEYLQLVKLGKFKSISSALWKYTIQFYNRCRVVIVQSTSVSKDLTDHGLKAAIQIVPNGIAFSSLNVLTEKQITAFRKKYQLNAPFILYVGRLSKEKNLDLLIEAFVKVHAKSSHTKLLIIGDGPIKNHLEKLAILYQVHKEVLFTGNWDHETLMRSGAFQAASLFVTPSTSEVQPMSVLEAMAAGLPIVGISAKGMVDLVKGNGCLVAKADSDLYARAILSFLAKSTTNKTMQEKSIKLAQKYAIDVVVDELEKIYSSLRKK